MRIEPGSCCENPAQGAATGDELLPCLELTAAIGAFALFGCEERMAEREDGGRKRQVNSPDVEFLVGQGRDGVDCLPGVQYRVPRRH